MRWTLRRYSPEITMKITPAAIAARPAMLVSLALVIVTLAPSLLRSAAVPRDAFNVRTEVVTRHRLMM